MYHPRFKGSHYEMGFHYGQLLFEKGVKFSNFIKLDDEQFHFGVKSLSVLKNIYPEIIEEMKGMSEAQNISLDRFAANLLTAGVFNKDYGCSCFCLKSDNELIFAKNHDMFSSLKKITESAVYRPDNDNIFIAQGDAIIGKEDGVNEHGLAVGVTFVAPKKIKPGINFLFIVRYFLEKCSTITECISFLNKIEISSSQNIILMDKTGEMVVIESCSEKYIIRKPQLNENFIIATNNFIHNDMIEYNNCPDKNWFHSQDRYNSILKCVINKNNKYSIDFAKDVLSGKYGFVCQYRKELKFETLYSFIVKLNDLTIYRAEGNPNKIKYEKENRLNWAIEKGKG